MEILRKIKQEFTLVTGASSGIGKAIAQECARLNMNLLLIALPGDDLTEFAKKLRVAVTKTFSFRLFMFLYIFIDLKQ